MRTSTLWFLRNVLTIGWSSHYYKNLKNNKVFINILFVIEIRKKNKVFIIIFVWNTPGFKKIFFLHIPSSWVKTQLLWYPRSGWKAMSRKRWRLKVSIKNGQLRLQPPPQVANASHLDQSNCGQVYITYLMYLKFQI